jgi:hypothetical protein
MLANESMHGTLAMPHAFVGVRVGYSVFKLSRHTRASSVWEPEVIFRAIATRREAPGYFLGLGLAWGD